MSDSLQHFLSAVCMYSHPLECLALSHTFIDREHFETIARSVMLRELDISECRFDMSDFCETMSNATRLERLIVRGNQLSSNDWHLLVKFICDHGQMVELVASGNTAVGTREDADDALEFPSLATSSLRCLDVAGCGISVDLLATLYLPPTLERLNIGHNFSGDCFAVALMENVARIFSSTPRLGYVDLSGNSLLAHAPAIERLWAESRIAHGFDSFSSSVSQRELILVGERSLS